MKPCRRKQAIAYLFLFLTALGATFFNAASYAQSKLAIVIDDLGYHPTYDAAVLAMPREISVAIIPTAPYAALRDHQADAQQRDILIHLPMQPLNHQRIEPGGLYLGMSTDEIARRVAEAKSVLPHAIGLNNHMGSAATADEALMSALMNALKQHHLFFLDSQTSGRSVAVKTAQKQGVKALTRHIFLDDSNQTADIQRQFDLALQHARKQGTAIVIGHPRKNTINVLQTVLATLPPDIRLINIGALWRNETVAPPASFILHFSEAPAPTSHAPFEYIPMLRGVPR